MLKWLKGKTRLRNVALWLFFAALVTDIHIFEGTLTPTASEQINFFAQRGLELLVAAGVLSNPTKAETKGYHL
jgi:hypothetical protein